MKFGGSSLGSPDAIDRVCGIIERSSTTPLVVVSAFGGTTDILTEAMLGDPGNGLALIRKLRQETISLTRNAVKSSHNDDAVEYVKSRFEFIETQIRKLDPDSEDYAIMLDEIICCGELVSSYVMTQALLSRKQNAVFLDARNIMLTTNDRGAASALFEPTREETGKRCYSKAQGRPDRGPGWLYRFQHDNKCLNDSGSWRFRFLSYVFRWGNRRRRSPDMDRCGWSDDN